MSCPVCHNTTAEGVIRDGIVYYTCPRCGRYELEISAEHTIKFWTLQQRNNLSGWIREHQDCRILSSDLPRLESLRTPAVGEKAQRLMLYFAKHNPKPGEYIKNLSNDELIGVCWAQDQDETTFIFYKYLIHERELIARVADNFGTACLQITPKGWSYLDDISSGKSDSQTGFVAMWFDKSVDPAGLAIEAGIRNSGYEPFRIDRKEHNNKIDDEIVAGIRRSKFLVADFTGHRGGVYFETGFATGLGLPVIWLCRQDELEKTHFDTRQYNFIVWEQDKLAELSKALQNRIEATIGRGPLVEKAAA
jgi:nucleoside 2-deoxyribosyltransferase